MENKKVLIIEQDSLKLHLLSSALQKEGIQTHTIMGFGKALEFIRRYIPDMIILNLSSCGIMGTQIFKTILAEFIIPIVIITDKNDIADKILAIEFGADEYITEPFDLREVIARIKSIFRRIELSCRSQKETLSTTIKLKRDIVIYKDQRRVVKGDKEIQLTNKEFDLLFFLAQNKGRVFYRAELLDHVWGFEYPTDTRTVDIHIRRIRKKLNENRQDSVIETVFGIGYKVVGNSNS